MGKRLEYPKNHPLSSQGEGITNATRSIRLIARDDVLRVHTVNLENGKTITEQITPQIDEILLFPWKVKKAPPLPKETDLVSLADTIKSKVH